MRLVLGFGAALGLLCAGPALAEDRVAAALDVNDPFAVETALKASGGLSAAQTSLLQGAAAAMRFEDQAAAEALNRGLADAAIEPLARARALSLLGGVQLRAGNYAAAAGTYDAALAMSDPSQSEDGRRSLKQTRDVAHALRGEPAQTREALREGRIPITRDAANLARSTGRVNGLEQEFILDTGAGYSTVTRSTAARLKLRLLPDQIAVGSSTAKAVPAQLGVAEDVEIAGNRFRHTVFLVMANEALSFAGGAYKIDAILGFPVLSRLERIEFVRAGAYETLRVAASRPAPQGATHDLYLDTLRPMVVVDIAGAGRVRLLLDSGAKQSSLNATFAETYPALAKSAPSEKATFGGAGGMQTIDVRVLRDIAFVADGRPRRVDKVTVSQEKKGEHGALGQDVLRAEGGFALDFKAMDFAFLPGAER